MAHTYLPDMMYYLLSSSDMIPFLSTLKKKKKANRQRHIPAWLPASICLSASANGYHLLGLYYFLPGFGLLFTAYLREMSLMFMFL